MLDRSAHFYSDLHAYTGKLVDIYSNRMHFCDVPEDWNIVVTDVEGSTIAIEEGRQQQVHLAATGSIAACLNISRDAGIDIPFFFGGDGATILMPDLILKDCLMALKYHQERCLTNFDFLFRVGYRSVKTMKARRSILKISKFQANSNHVIPLIQGNALQHAESDIKQRDHQDLGISEISSDYLDLAGMDCKWNKVAPPIETNEILTLIITSVNVDNQHEIYGEILKKLDKIYGNDAKRNPLTLEHLNVTSNFSELLDQVQIQRKRFSFRHLLRSFMSTIFGKYYLYHTQDGQEYLQELIELTETLLMDGSINTVITGSKKQRRKLMRYLDDLEEDTQISFGYYVSESSVLSCYVTTLDGNHIHFLDGDNGGFTQASKVLKKKLRSE
ncbi:Protein of unknown function [Nonlabens sp. Hel1_33_55]|nr:Protein of unknown function [Nonlabens sp. Hel1_33_55]